METTKSRLVPSAFVKRRLHSIAGIWLSLYLIEHLLVNSQAALFIGENGHHFIHEVDSIQDLPYLIFIEIFLLGVPIAIHLYLGIEYLFTAKMNSFPTDGSKPSLQQYPRNHAFTWQRITSWILVFGIIAHVIHMRIIEYPHHATQGGTRDYMTRLHFDDGLYTLSQRLNFTIYDKNQIDKFKDEFEKHINPPVSEIPYESPLAKKLITEQQHKEHEEWIKALESKPLKKGEVVAVTKDFGTAELLMVRDTFKMPIMLVLYTLFVLGACYHAYNGFWTFLIKWGITLTERSQRLSRYVTTAIMLITAFFGLAAIWGTYWINLKQ